MLPALLLLACSTHAAQVTGLQALHHDGQTFLTWTSPPGGGWNFRVYRSFTPIQSGLGLESSDLLGSAPDSSWCDRRLYNLSGALYGLSVDSAAAPLDSTRGLFVWTPDAAASVWYAVTCQAQGHGEDTSITPGANSLALPVNETPAPPRPVYQRRVTGPFGKSADVYTLWTSNIDTPYARAMCNRPSEAWDLSVGHGAKHGPLIFQPHQRGGGFYLAYAGLARIGEWAITMDDFVRTPEVNTFWFGYHEGYDIESMGVHTPPVSGVVHDYTARRVEYTLEWARRNFPVDTTRVYVAGSSMGGIGSVFLALWRPDLIAAALVIVARFDFSLTADANPNCAFNEGGGQRASTDGMWGTVSTGLRMDDGTPVYQRLNSGALARARESSYVPPIIAFSGRRDTLIGWSEKIPFYQAMRESRAGGTFFWDTRTHTNTSTCGAWAPIQGTSCLGRFRTDLSFPALSNCSADGNPGDGHAADGDSIGTINGFVEWDDTIVDQPGLWEVRLKLRDLSTLWGTVSSPDSVTVDVTPRRLQHFVPTGQAYALRVIRSSDGAIVQSGSVSADGLGVLTVAGVKVFRSGTLLAIGTPAQVGVGPPNAGRSAALPAIGALMNPLRGRCALAIEWPRAGESTVTVLDVAGRAVRTVFRGRAQRGSQTLSLDPSGLPGGIYFVTARQGEAQAVRRVVITD